MDKSTLFGRIDEYEPQLKRIAQDLWENPELGLHEEESAKILISALDEEGFEIETGIGGMPTAFIASYGDGEPAIGILGEYDALPGLSQDVSANREPVEPDGPGHGCGHNLFGTAGVGAAIAVADAIDAGELEGRVVFYGCPAEETLVGKTYMARAGAFDDVDAAITWHPGDLNTPRLGSTNALNSLMFTFEGVSAHAGGSPDSGRSALDGVELLNTGVEYMREHISDDARLHYAITDGGQAPNVVPAEATVWYFVRAPDREEVERNTDWLRDIAEAAAMMTQTDVTERFLTGCYDYRANNVVSDVIWENMQEVGPIDYTEDDHEFARDLRETIPEDRIESNLANVPDELYAEIRDEALYSDPVQAYDEDRQSHGSTEVGDVSWIVPTGQFRAATWPVGAPGHSWQVVAANGDFGKEGVAFAAKVLAGTTYDLLADESTLEAAHDEFETEIGTDAYETPLPADAEPPFDVTTMGN
ncbi:M20 family amidohydrolase (homolog to p-aminobenzoyl-glutamate hydrolase subunit B) (plasmid) [Natrialba magadii ATCC 43099]|uniref:Amidohydrolase n=1 Tax=Natrialba magadii (strain ATCC 43099 / DSM 3394 / CCM 3739 / CIP 104546 / IAM 13178 / JCM 8861 / NBRC 102185 / NCIMB 2190 / MS3) TaxID=547559 RepID=D3T1X7_NATMM|nr:amidohydrolase [Natrialba magadii]ADD07586.1 M20 family amidohydrolase (homolog to p-aminobenzoyl-glutamate hydrolase subunit B) [Natrialba magadii ATCC 43099]ELY27063.1 amidohydrolase [Natrialba magadii ATCC 43099]